MFSSFCPEDEKLNETRKGMLNTLSDLLYTSLGPRILFSQAQIIYTGLGMRLCTNLGNLGPPTTCVSCHRPNYPNPSPNNIQGCRNSTFPSSCTVQHPTLNLGKSLETRLLVGSVWITHPYCTLPRQHYLIPFLVFLKQHSMTMANRIPNNVRMRRTMIVTSKHFETGGKNTYWVIYICTSQCKKCTSIDTKLL